ncbi:uncharacterized protein RB166_020014 [Leptodactylus fuscus]|uniref:uncharacterized protein LOC142184398 n=1 Tax=Leptodactylus fuscus TaxID=238119 RepID=UPI003F4EB229
MKTRMNQSKNVEIPEKTRLDALKNRDGRTKGKPPHENTTGLIVTLEKRTRGRPRNITDTTTEASQVGVQRISTRNPQKYSKIQELMLSTGDIAEDMELSEKRKGRSAVSKDDTATELNKGERRENVEVIKRGRGRPIGSTKKKTSVKQRPHITDTLDGNKSTSPPARNREKGRAKKKTSGEPQPRRLSMRVRKINADSQVVAEEKAKEETNVEKNMATNAKKNLKEAVNTTKPSQEKRRLAEKRKMMVSFINITEEINHGGNSEEEAMLMAKKRRGRPRKGRTDVVENSQQIPQEVCCPGVKCEESVDKDSLSQTDAQTSQGPEWKQHPIHTEDVVVPQDSNVVTQWVLDDSSETQQLDFQQVLLKELSEFKSQMTRELEATRGEVREGAELVRSAIAGVSAEIHRLGLILQPLVNVLSTANLYTQQSTCAPVTSLLCPQQDIPSEDTTQPPTPPIDTSSSPNGETSSFHIPSHDTEVASSTKSLPVEPCLVKKEDPSESDQPCAYQSETIVSLQEDQSAAQSLFLPHLDSPKVVSARSFHRTSPDLSADVPDTITHSNSTYLHTSSVDHHEVISDVTHTILLSDQVVCTVSSSGSPQEPPSSVTSHNITDKSYPSEPISFSVSPDRYSPASTTALYFNQDQSTIESTKSSIVHIENLCPTYSKIGHLSSDQCLENAGPPLAGSKTLLCQTEDPSMTVLAAPFVTLPQSFISSSALMSVDQPIDFEGDSSKQNSFQLPQNFTELSHSAEVPVFAQPTCPLSQVCAQIPQVPPISLLSHTPLLQPERDFTQMLQGATD